MLVRGGDGAIRALTGVPLWLVNLMIRPELHGKLRLGPEDQESILLADRLRAAAFDGKLLATFTHVPHEVGGKGKFAAIRMNVAKALGMIAGSADFVFVARDGGGWIEMKSKTGKLTDRQKDFREWCQDREVRWACCRTADEAWETLKGWGMIA